MAVDIQPQGNGTWVGAPGGASSFSVTEESTPLAGGDDTGAIGGGQFNVVPNDLTLLLMHDDLEIEDDHSGRMNVRVAGVTDTDGIATVEIDSRAILLMAHRRLAPYNGTLGGWMTQAFAACSITRDFIIEAAVASRPVTFPGHDGIVWDAIKQVCAAQRIELSVVSSNIVVRPIRTRELSFSRITSVTHGVGVGDMARNVEITSYSNEWMNSGLVYPTGRINEETGTYEAGWNPDVQIVQVGANETVEVDLQTDVSIATIVQPTPVVFVSRTHSSSSVYGVAGNDGLPIQPAQWLAEGGKLEVSIGEDFKTIKVKVTGPSNEDLGPYQISMNSGTSDAYSSLRIVGSGVWMIPDTRLHPTGVSDDMTAQLIGETIELPFANGASQIGGLAISAAQQFAGSEQSLSVSGTAFNRKGDSGSQTYPDFIDFDSAYAGQTFGQFDATNAGTTFSEFDEEMNELVADSFINQAFGNLAGARVKWAHQWWRVRSATISESDQAIVAEPDTTFGDFGTVYNGVTFADFDAAFAGFKFSEFDLIPLRGV